MLKVSIICNAFLLLVILNYTSGDVSDKYRKDTNQKDFNHQKPGSQGGKLTHNQAVDKPFRTNKLNLVWQKALKKFEKDDPALPRLLRDLKAHDKLHLELKRRIAEHEDDNGEYEAIVREKLMEILESYDLAESHPYSDEDTRKQNESLDKADIRGGFTDKRLSKIWEKARGAGFLDEELEELRTELQHQQQKVDEYMALKSELLGLDNVHENSLERLQRTEEEEQLIAAKQLQLKQANRDMKEGYQFLEASAKKVKDEAPDFSDPRVIDLWLQVNKGNFSSEELDSFREELRHFEHKIAKWRFLKDELEAVKNNADGGPARLNKEGKLAQKLGDYDRKIKKTYSEIKSRVGAASLHNEL